MKGIVVYKGKYGATSQYAHWLGEELELPVIDADTVDADDLRAYNYIIIGGSVYVGALQVKAWIKTNLPVLETKRLFFFIVCATPPHEKMKLAKIADDNIPASLRNEKNVHFLPGRVIKKDLSFTDRLVLKMGAMMQKDPAARKAMLQDFDGVKQEHLLPLIKAVYAARPVRSVKPFTVR